jgi:hypothetical protein
MEEKRSEKNGLGEEMSYSEQQVSGIEATGAGNAQT